MIFLGYEVPTIQSLLEELIRNKIILDSLVNGNLGYLMLSTCLNKNTKSSTVRMAVQQFSNLGKSSGFEAAHFFFSHI